MTYFAKLAKTANTPEERKVYARWAREEAAKAKATKLAKRNQPKLLGFAARGTTFFVTNY